ncbi:MAG TPA: NAD(P)-dependent oxidoreductase [Terriglobales bacterium]|nr:NAD(P)-dependent oxidoreductase [Terriglobales bacterium]
MAKPRVAILGVGLMGSGMAGRLLAANFPLSIYNRNQEKAKPFADVGAFLASTPREAAARADIVISMLADDSAARSVWLGENGALSGAVSGSILVESSTVSVNWIKELALAASPQRCELLDAPVTGSKVQAAAGELRFLVGGSASALETARPVLSAMGNDIIHFGPTGSGAIMKLINNFMSGVQVASLAEATALIHASGLDHDKAMAVLTSGAPGSPLVKLLSARAKAGDFTPNFVLRLMAKDLAYAIKEGSDREIDLKTAAGALAVFQQAMADGYGEQDLSAVIESSLASVKTNSKT